MFRRPTVTLLPSLREAAGRARVGGVSQQTRCQRNKWIDPPPPTPPHHAQGRVGGGERTAHDFAISPNAFFARYSFISRPPNRGRRECRAPDAPCGLVCKMG